MQWLRPWRKWLPVVLLLIAWVGLHSKPGLGMAIGAFALLSLLVVMANQAYLDWMRRTVRLREARRIIRDTAPPRCQSCNYDLTGNTSGVCPECGTHIHRRPRAYLAMTPMARRIIDRAEAHARANMSDHLGTEHLPAALFTEPDSVAAAILNNLGIDLSDVLSQIEVVRNRDLPSD